MHRQPAGQRITRRLRTGIGDIPQPRPTIAPVAPPVAAPLERVLEIKRRLLRPHPHGLFASALEQDGKSRRPGRRQFARENLEQGMAIVDCPVSLVEEAGTIQEVAEARTFEAVFPPFDLGRGAPPCLPLEY